MRARATLALARAAAFAERRRWWIVGALVVAQWLVVAGLAVNAEHNGWIFQHGDDGSWYWTSGWALSSLHIPYATVGLGWPYLLSPVAAVFGRDMADGLPAVIIVNQIVFVPACVVGMYLIGDRIAGRLFGLWTSLLWVVLPLAGIGLYASHARHVLTDTLVPTAFGLNALSDFPSMAFAIASALLILRAGRSGDLWDAALLGVTLGFLVLIKPSNGPMVVVALVALLFARRFRLLPVAAIAMAPALVALIVWKRVGVGQAIVTPPKAAGSSSHGAVVQAHASAGVVQRVLRIPQNYISIDMHHVGQNFHDLHELFWSMRLLEFLLVAGIVALLARGRWKGFVIAAWFVAYLVVKGTTSDASVFDSSLYRYLMPAWPAWVVIVAGVVFCVPIGRHGRAHWHDAKTEVSREVVPASRRLVAVAVVVLGLGPLVVVAVASPVNRGTLAQMPESGAPVAIVDFGLRAHRGPDPKSVVLTWRPVRTKRAESNYKVFRGSGPDCPVVGSGAPMCRFSLPLIVSTTRLSTEDTGARGRVTYRVALAGGSRVHPTGVSDLLLLSKPVTINVP